MHLLNAHTLWSSQRTIRTGDSIWGLSAFPFQTMVTHLNFSVPALYLEIRAIDRGTDKVSSQRFSYFGSLAMGEEGDDGACAK